MCVIQEKYNLTLGCDILKWMGLLKYKCDLKYIQMEISVSGLSFNASLLQIGCHNCKRNIQYLIFQEKS